MVEAIKQLGSKIKMLFDNKNIEDKKSNDAINSNLQDIESAVEKATLAIKSKSDNEIIKSLAEVRDQIEKQELAVHVEAPIVKVPEPKIITDHKEVKDAIYKLAGLIAKQGEDNTVRILNSAPADAVPVVLTTPDKKRFYKAVDQIVTGIASGVPKERNGGVPVNLQDQTSEPIDTMFAQELGTFSLAEDVTVSTELVLNYDFEAVAGHGLNIGDEILLAQVDRAFRATIINVATNTITVDTPIDFAFTTAAFGLLINTNMVVDGTTPKIFSIRAGTTEVDITRVILTMTSSAAMDDSLFGSLTALTNGLIFRVVNGFQKSVFNFKSNQDIKQFCYDLSYSNRAPAGQFGLVARITFSGQAKHGVALRIGTDDVLQWVVQDDLTGGSLTTLKVSAEGHKITD